jgi:hypothetical protein
VPDGQHPEREDRLEPARAQDHPDQLRCHHDEQYARRKCDQRDHRDSATIGLPQQGEVLLNPRHRGKEHIVEHFGPIAEAGTAIRL